MPTLTPSQYNEICLRLKSINPEAYTTKFTNPKPFFSARYSDEDRASIIRSILHYGSCSEEDFFTSDSHNPDAKLNEILNEFLLKNTDENTVTDIREDKKKLQQIYSKTDDVVDEPNWIEALPDPVLTAHQLNEIYLSLRGTLFKKKPHIINELTSYLSTDITDSARATVFRFVLRHCFYIEEQYSTRYANDLNTQLNAIFLRYALRKNGEKSVRDIEHADIEVDRIISKIQTTDANEENESSLDQAPPLELTALQFNEILSQLQHIKKDKTQTMCGEAESILTCPYETYINDVANSAEFNDEERAILIRFTLKATAWLERDNVDSIVTKGLNKIFTKYALKTTQEVTVHDISFLGFEINDIFEKVEQLKEQSACKCDSIAFSMQVLSLFIGAVGIVTIAVAFTAMNAATFGMPGIAVAIAGGATALLGFGLFSAGPIDIIPREWLEQLPSLNR